MRRSVTSSLRQLAAAVVLLSATSLAHGELSLSYTSGTCGTHFIGSHNTKCPPLTVTAVGSAETLTRMDPLYLDSRTTCQVNMTLNPNQSCTVVPAPTVEVIGSQVASWQIKTATDTYTLSLSFVGEGHTITPSTYDFGSVPLGQSKTATFTVSTNRSIYLMNAGTFSGQDSEFTVLPQTCTPGRMLVAGISTCTFQVRFSPGSIGQRTLTINVRAGINGSSPSDYAGSAALHLTGTGAPLTSWRTGEYGACTGGSGEWQIGNWAPITGCGLVKQTRSVSCQIDAFSGTQTRTVECVNYSGEVVSDSKCDPKTRPSESRSCTPVDPSVCGASPETERVVELSNNCPTGCQPDAANNKYCLMMPL